MKVQAEQISYKDTNSFSKLVNDYLHQAETLTPFYNRFPLLENVKVQLQEKAKQPINRQVLHKVLKDQYTTLEKNEKVNENIELLLNENTFTICTAHQPNIFTGHLYFIYKILHAAKIADTLSKELKEYNFVPVYYMGSEDADLEELGTVTLDGVQYKWETKQTGAVGRMMIDDGFLEILKKITQRYSVEDNGVAIIEVLKKCYVKDRTIQDATLELVHSLLGDYGVIVLIADHQLLKQQMIPVFEKEVTENASNTAVAKANYFFTNNYKQQAYSRPINIFYFNEGVRERIELIGENYKVHNTDISFAKTELVQTIKEQPELFSPNVILRGLFQETILPNITFIGGGGEMAYWLQLKNIFSLYNITYPILVLRNSFLLQNQKQATIFSKLGFTSQDSFSTLQILEKKYVITSTDKLITSDFAKEAFSKTYELLKKNGEAIDKTLVQYIAALEKKHIKHLHALDKKLIRAEKRNHEVALNQLRKVKATLFPNNSLQERVENIIPYLSKYGKEIFQVIYDNSLGLEQQFTIVTLEH